MSLALVVLGLLLHLEGKIVDSSLYRGLNFMCVRRKLKAFILLIKDPMTIIKFSFSGYICLLLSWLKLSFKIFSFSMVLPYESRKFY